MHYLIYTVIEYQVIVFQKWILISIKLIAYTIVIFILHMNDFEIN